MFNHPVFIASPAGHPGCPRGNTLYSIIRLMSMFDNVKRCLSVSALLYPTLTVKDPR